MDRFSGHKTDFSRSRLSLWAFKNAEFREKVGSKIIQEAEKNAWPNHRKDCSAEETSTSNPCDESPVMESFRQKITIVSPTIAGIFTTPTAPRIRIRPSSRRVLMRPRKRYDFVFCGQFPMLTCKMDAWQKMTFDRDCSTTANSTGGWLTSYFRGGSSSGSALLCPTADRPRVLGRCARSIV